MLVCGNVGFDFYLFFNFLNLVIEFPYMHRFLLFIFMYSDNILY